MNWDAIGAIGQLLGSVAVLVTLWYLAVQVRDARDEARRAIIQRRSDGVRENLMAIATDARLVAINTKASAELGVPTGEFTKQLVERTSLTEEEAYALSLQYWSTWQVYVPVVQSLDDLPADERAASERNIRRQFGINTVGRLWFDTSKQVLHEKIVRRVEKLLEGRDTNG